MKECLGKNMLLFDITFFYEVERSELECVRHTNRTFRHYSVLPVPLSLLWTYFVHCFGISIADFTQIDTGCAVVTSTQISGRQQASSWRTIAKKWKISIDLFHATGLFRYADTETSGFLIFSWGIERDQRHEMN